MPFGRHDIAKLVGTAIAVGALGLTTPGSAAADATGDAFMRKVFADGLDFDYPGEVIARAQRVCAAFSAGLSPARVYETMLDNYHTLTPGQTALFMADAVQFYCPRYTVQFIS